ncbi:MAG TPA: hypothetical protein PKA57_02875, partial [Parvibaculum sp.]|nr:hypothetical protein [Parvibaculum sp.]
MSNQGPAQEPTMEEILASIRRIISEDSGGKDEREEVPPPPPAFEEEPVEAEAVSEEIEFEEEYEEVLELT